jgi:hypothetical protein
VDEERRGDRAIRGQVPVRMDTTDPDWKYVDLRRLLTVRSGGAADP